MEEVADSAHVLVLQKQARVLVPIFIFDWTLCLAQILPRFAFWREHWQFSMAPTDSKQERNKESQAKKEKEMSLRLEQGPYPTWN